MNEPQELASWLLYRWSECSSDSPSCLLRFGYPFGVWRGLAHLWGASEMISSDSINDRLDSVILDILGRRLFTKSGIVDGLLRSLVFLVLATFESLLDVLSHPLNETHVLNPSSLGILIGRI